MHKKQLTEQFIVWDKIPNILTLDNDAFKSDALKNYAFKNRRSEDEFHYKYNYYSLGHHQHLDWLLSYILDHFFVEYKRSLSLFERSVIIQNKGDSINTHHHLDEYNIKKSPDMSCLYCVDIGEKVSYIIFESEGGRRRHGKWKIPMEKGKLIIFNSELPHHLTQNENEDPIVNISLQFQLI